MAESQHSSSAPDFTHPAPPSGVYRSGWESRPVTVPRTLALEKSLTLTEKAVGLLIHTVLDNVAQGGEPYNWLEGADEIMESLGVTADELQATAGKLHDLGYVTVVGRPAPEQPTAQQRAEAGLKKLGRDFLGGVQ